MTRLIDLLLHADRSLLDLVTAYGRWIYGILFLIVFAETGFVVTPFLPGDSLLFAAGTLAARQSLDWRILTGSLITAAFVGNADNYTVGRRVGERVIRLAQTDPRWGRWISPIYIARAHAFFEYHGGKAIVLGRFVPIVRTFVPFVAGAAKMSYPAFALYNIVGSGAWVGICVAAGYVFGNVPVVRDNFSLVALGIVFVSILPIVIEYVKHRRHAGRSGSSAAL
jgi:membrane-associated protein